MHVGQVKAGLRASGRRLAQCSSVVIKTKKRFPMQIDGEPWMQPPCTCDGQSLDLATGPSLQGIAFLNIPSIYGGSNLWGDNSGQKKRTHVQWKKKKDRGGSAYSFQSVDLSTAVQDIGDTLIEVIGLENCMHVGQVKAGLRASGRRLAQCSSVVIKTKKRFPMQIDGEPWMQPPCTIRIIHKNQMPMLIAPVTPKTKFPFSLFKKSK
ncbi:diacylglycerol kinase 1-like [Centruroides sculpturatus]|uniref:diacylglycerol kinase 1-like n=1 Tax=Centruroides sculpturatus TaxID=218467 RepID=UPI000C6E047E|nr:diacylglycerol kinase 1-like [Centruroides sculpturatus]